MDYGLEKWRVEERLNVTLVSFYITVVILMSVVKTRKVGGSLVITLPKKLVESKKIKEGEILERTIKKVRKDGFGIFRGMKPFTAADELTTHD
jgi:antitoxin component of MazEF toxin-antitoxin module